MDGYIWCVIVQVYIYIFMKHTYYIEYIVVAGGALQTFHCETVKGDVFFGQYFYRVEYFYKKNDMMICE